MSSSKPIATRSQASDKCSIFGSPSELPPNVLPTKEDVAKYMLLVQKQIEEKPSRSLLLKAVIAHVVEQLEAVWNKASIPTIQRSSITKQLHKIHDELRDIKKPPKEQQQTPSYQKKLKSFKDNYKLLLDLAACKCEPFDICECSKELRVPREERSFLLDQRTTRKMMIGGIDNIISQRIKRKMVRSNPQPSTSRAVDHEEQVQDDLILSSTTDSEQSSQVSLMSINLRVRTTERNTMDLKNLAIAVDRYQVSDRAGAAIASAVLKDYGIIADDSPEDIIDRSKVRRAREMVRKSLKPNLELTNLLGLYFDGRIDRTLTRDGNQNKTTQEEHIVLIKEPSSEYLGHVTPKSGSAESIVEAIEDFAKTNHLSLDSLKVIGCDGTNVNTGNIGGVIAILERNIGRSFHRAICMLHANELPLRHLIQHLDGATTGPQSFTGVIGKQLRNCESLPVVNYKPIQVEIPSIGKAIKLSSDQQYLYDICEAIRMESTDAGVFKRAPGKVVHSRWLTTANRILRLYVSSVNPSYELKTLAEFITKVYAVMWFEIKRKPSIVYGAQHLHKLMKLSRYLPKHLKEIIDPVISRNGYFGHCESLLLAMLHDESETIRKLAYLRIRLIREEPEVIRKFIIPKFNFDSENYYDMVYWRETEKTESPLTEDFSLIQLKEMFVKQQNVNSNVLELKEYPCHSQSVERAIKLVTSASSMVCGNERRDGVIRSTLESRKNMPTFETKKDFK